MGRCCPWSCFRANRGLVETGNRRRGTGRERRGASIRLTNAPRDAQRQSRAGNGPFVGLNRRSVRRGAPRCVGRMDCGVLSYGQSVSSFGRIGVALRRTGRPAGSESRRDGVGGPGTAGGRGPVHSGGMTDLLWRQWVFGDHRYCSVDRQVAWWASRRSTHPTAEPIPGGGVRPVAGSEDLATGRLPGATLPSSGACRIARLPGQARVHWTRSRGRERGTRRRWKAPWCASFGWRNGLSRNELPPDREFVRRTGGRRRRTGGRVAMPVSSPRPGRGLRTSYNSLECRGPVILGKGPESGPSGTFGARSMGRWPASLCESCRARREVVTPRGSRFLLCGRSADDSRFPKYPMQPVLRCAGHEPRDESGADPGRVRAGGS